jgi:hypothetical protein
MEHLKLFILTNYSRLYDPVNRFLIVND